MCVMSDDNTVCEVQTDQEVNVASGVLHTSGGGLRCEYINSGQQGVTNESPVRLVVRENVHITCNAPGAGVLPALMQLCTMAFRFDGGIHLMPGATISAPVVIIRNGGPVGPGGTYIAGGPALISSGAAITATGLGRCGATSPPELDTPPNGGENAGWGGACDDQNAERPRGDGTQPMRDENDVDWVAGFGGGVMYEANGLEARCCGGGYVAIFSTEPIVINGNITSDGQQPCQLTATPDKPGCAVCDASRGAGTAPQLESRECAGIAGAAGGTVLINAPYVNGTGVVSASGVDADEVCMPHHTFFPEPYHNLGNGGGGSGGRVLVPRDRGDGDYAVRARAWGGKSHSAGPTCTNGAAGTVFYSVISSNAGTGIFEYSRLHISHDPARGFTSSASTLIASDAQPEESIGEIRVERGAALQLEAILANTRIFTVDKQFVLDTNAVLQIAPEVSVWAGDMQVLTSSSIFGYGRAAQMRQPTVRLNVSSLYVTAQSDISNLLELVVRGAARVEGPLSSPDRMTVRVGSLLLDTLGALRAGRLDLYATDEVRVQGQMQASDTFQTQGAPLVSLDCNKSLESQGKMARSYTLFLFTSGELHWDANSLLAAGQVAICADRMFVQGTITATALGLPSGQGWVDPSNPGIDDDSSSRPGQSCISGPGSGGGHGGRGGNSTYGGVNQTAPDGSGVRGQCLGGAPYGDKNAPMTPGSGGGVGGNVESGQDGGQGGGVIVMRVRGQLRMSGSGRIEARGGESVSMHTGASVDMPSREGGGGGAGGSIFIQAGRLMQDRESGDVAWAIRVNGGDGGEGLNGGGDGSGGGGGLIAVRPPDGQDDWEIVPSAGWQNQLYVDGGESHAGYGRGTPGQPGMYTGPVCAPGNQGVSCQPCGEGRYRNGDMRECEPCPIGRYGENMSQANCMLCPFGKAAVETGQSACRSCSEQGRAPGFFANNGDCVRCPAALAPGRSQFLPSCRDGLSTLECECTVFVCESTFVSFYNLTCGPFTEVILLVPAGELGRVLILGVPLCLGAACLLIFRQRVLRGRSIHCDDVLATLATLCFLSKYYKARRGGRRAKVRQAVTEKDAIELDSLGVTSLNRKPPSAPSYEGLESEGALESVGAYEGLGSILRAGHSLGGECISPRFEQQPSALSPTTTEITCQSSSSGTEAPHYGISGVDVSARIHQPSNATVVSHKSVSFRNEHVSHAARSKRPGSGSVGFELGEEGGVQGMGGGALTPGGVEEQCEEEGPVEVSLLSGGVHKFESLSNQLAWEEERVRVETHVLRIHLSGANSTTKPWKMPALTPRLAKVFVKEEYYKLGIELEAATYWQQWELLLHAVLLIFIPPLVSHFDEWRRRQHYNAAHRVVSSLSEDRSEGLWRSLATRVGAEERIEFGCCPLAQFAWLDTFFDAGGGAAKAAAGAKARGHGKVRRWLQSFMDKVRECRHRRYRHGSTAARGLFGRGLGSFARGSTGHSLSHDVLSQRRETERSQSAADHAENASSHEGSHTNLNGRHEPAAIDVWSEFDLMLQRGELANAKSLVGRQSDMALQAEPPRLELQADRPLPPLAPLDATDDYDEAGNSRLKFDSRPRLHTCIPLCGKCSYLAPAFLDVSDFATHAALSEVLGAQTMEVAALINATLASVDRTSPLWAVRLAEVLRLLERINHHLHLAHAQFYEAGRATPESVPLDSPLHPGAQHPNSGATPDLCSERRLTSEPRSRCATRDASRSGYDLGGGAQAAEGSTAAERPLERAGACPVDDNGEAAFIPKPLLLLALVHRRPGEAAGQEKHRQLALAVGEGLPSSWRLPKGHTRLTPRRLNTTYMGKEFVQEFFPPTPERSVHAFAASSRSVSIASVRKERISSLNTAFSAEVDQEIYETRTRTRRRGWQMLDLLRVVACGAFVPPHPHLFTAAVLLLLLCSLDFLLTILLIGTYCTAAEGTGECAGAMLIVPFALVVAPVYGVFATLRVWLGMGNDVVKLLKLGELIDPRALSDASPGASMRMLRRVSLWNAASLLNAAIALACALPMWRSDRLFTSRFPWVLPLCLLLNKLLLSQAYHLLSAATGLVKGAHTLLMSLLGRRDGHVSS